MITIPQSKEYKKKKRFDINSYKKPFFFNEVKGYKLARYPKFKNKKFWKSSDIYKKERILIISGPGRSGNHLFNALIDGNKSFSNCVGEDSFLSGIFSQAIKNEKRIITSLKSGKFNFYNKLSQFKKNFELKNKWGKVYKTFVLFSKKSKKQKKILFKKWYYRPSGNQPGKATYILDYRNFIPNIDYKNFKAFFVKERNKFKKIENIFDFIFLYLKAIRILMRTEKKNFKYKNIIFESGMRRESYFLLKNHNNTILLCPIRKFDGMLMSFLKARHNFTSVRSLRKKNVLLYWAFWRHKVIDYLILQKKFPKKVFLINYENLVNSPEKSMKMILGKIGVKYEKKNKFPTIQNKLVAGNSSFTSNGNSKLGKIYKNNFFKKFKINEKVKFNDEYYDILKYINKKIINKI